MDLLRRKKVLLGITLALIFWIAVLGLFWILKKDAPEANPGIPKSPARQVPAPSTTSKPGFGGAISLPTSSYPDDVYVKEPKRIIKTTAESMAIRTEDSYRAKVLEFVKKDADIEYQGIRTRSAITLEVSGKRVQGYWLKVKTTVNEGWIFSPGTDYADV